jgi:sugar (pentulose or hexulose) kinase
MPPLKKAADILGPVLPEFARATGLAAETPVHCGIHDSNASLYPHLAQRTAPFSVASTGTWVISFAVGGTLPKLDPARDTLMNVNAFGQPVPSARFMGGREFEMLGPDIAGEPEDEDRRQVLQQLVMLTPALVQGSGPFAQHKHQWLNAEHASPAQKRVAASYYLAMTEATCLALIGAQGPSIVEGPFARNPDFMDMLAVATGRVCLANLGGSSGTSLGAAMLAGAMPEPQLSEHPQSRWSQELLRYKQAWTSLL